MDNDREDLIRRRAHRIWEESGRPDGQDRDHWNRAEREIADEEIKDPHAAAGGGGVPLSVTDALAAGKPARSAAPRRRKT